MSAGGFIIVMSYVIATGLGNGIPKVDYDTRVFSSYEECMRTAKEEEIQLKIAAKSPAQANIFNNNQPFLQNIKLECKTLEELGIQ